MNYQKWMKKWFQRRYANGSQQLLPRALWANPEQSQDQGKCTLVFANLQKKKLICSLIKWNLDDVQLPRNELNQYREEN
jgi:hypothetical protein